MRQTAWMTHFDKMRKSLQLGKGAICQSSRLLVALFSGVQLDNCIAQTFWYKCAHAEPVPSLFMNGSLRNMPLLLNDILREVPKLASIHSSMHGSDNRGRCLGDVDLHGLSYADTFRTREKKPRQNSWFNFCLMFINTGEDSKKMR
jgi:hypothetical protein